ncbi:MAG: hypothetical protein LBO64_03265 [Desulfovibrio sp.]|nr:hypothetical protein [Desulfovibrio sp.]
MKRVNRPARIFRQILAAKQEQAGFARYEGSSKMRIRERLDRIGRMRY